ncbi:MAG: ABC transporter substrate-binding protein [Nitrospirales bacterium]|nr:cobalamin-binding protein [Nitrospirales bacterium]
MKNRVQSSRLHKPWGFFILSRMCHRRLCLVLRWSGILLWGLVTSAVLANGTEGESMKRRQQGILTGMPFMANIAPRTFVDDLDRKLYLAKPPTRIVSLAPSITEMLFAIGLDREIVGVTDFCNYPPEALAKPKVAYSQPNLEALVALQPQLVLAPPSFLRADLLAKLEQLKIPIFVLESKTVEGIFGHIQLLGRMVARVPEANAFTASMRKQVGDLTKRVEGRPRPTLLYVLNSEPLITVGPGSFIHHLIELAGGRNAAERANAPYPRLTMEEVLTQNPDILLFPVGEYEGIPQAEQDRWKRWESLRAVKEGKLFQIKSDLLNRPGPRVIEGLRELVMLLHPDVSLSATVEESRP